jgi:peptidoglycan L-alanyl-D-glutamate endopeptidase CwlK
MKYPYSASSAEKLGTCDPRLQRVFLRAADFWDITIMEGHRSVERQKALFRTGASKIDGVRRKGNHNYSPSRAVDAAPLPLDWRDTQRFYQFGWAIVGLARSMGVMLRWGGDWDSDGDTSDQVFNDLVHFEVVDE